MGAGLFSFQTKGADMKFILILAVVFITTAADAHCWGGNSYRQQIERLETQVQNEQRARGSWQIAAFVLGIGCIGALVAGTALGSKGRRDAGQ
jgi:DMSO reductase anchor subunit